VHLHIEGKLRKKFSVSIDSVQRYIDSDFGLTSAPRVTPDTVWLEGPGNIIRALPETLQLTLPQDNIRKDFNEAVTLPTEGNARIAPQPQKVYVSFGVEKLVRVDTQITLSIINVPARLKASPVAKEITCAYRLPASVSKTFADDSLVAVVDLKDKPPGTHKLVPKITGLPESAVVIKTDTVLISF
ncbi:MAG TPA: hypothetical protein VFM90_01795, partial [Cyclobacteriaceae bacterium]|nr:hypothetical protein [Cyclobacteriaceae bacterium]